METLEKQLQLIGTNLISIYGDIYDFLRAYRTDKTSVNYSFSCLIDNLNRDGDIADETLQNVILEYDNTCNTFVIECLDNTYNMEV